MDGDHEQGIIFEGAWLGGGGSSHDRMTLFSLEFFFYAFLTYSPQYLYFLHNGPSKKYSSSTPVYKHTFRLINTRPGEFQKTLNVNKYLARK